MEEQDAVETLSRKEAIKNQARDLGFDDCRVTTAAPPESAAQFNQWIATGQHGEMAYLQRNAQKRVDPQKVLPGAKSIIVLGASYGEVQSPRSKVQSQRPAGEQPTTINSPNYPTNHGF